jgi:hypothetical protein
MSPETATSGRAHITKQLTESALERAVEQDSAVGDLAFLHEDNDGHK